MSWVSIKTFCSLFPLWYWSFSTQITCSQQNYFQVLEKNFPFTGVSLLWDILGRCDLEFPIKSWLKMKWIVILSWSVVLITWSTELGLSSSDCAFANLQMKKSSHKLNESWLVYKRVSQKKKSAKYFTFQLSMEECRGNLFEDVP